MKFAFPTAQKAMNASLFLTKELNNTAVFSRT